MGGTLHGWSRATPIGVREFMGQQQQKNRIDPKLLELLICPLSKGKLTLDSEHGELISRAAKLAYPVRDGIPVLLPSEARSISEEEADLGSMPPPEGRR